MTRFSRRDFMNYAGKIGIAGVGGSALRNSLGGWGLSDLTSNLDAIKGYASSIKKSSDAAMKAMEDFTPEQEYYIGRTVGAVIINKYKPFNDKNSTSYINIVGQTLAQASDLPETFNGYHLLILDTDEINAFATPSGLIFVSRGMLRCCSNEGELAAILAHEIGHVQFKHGIQSIEKGRITEAIAVIGIEATKTFADSDIASLTETFEGSINDITTTMINNGYSRSFEEEADNSAVTILERVGYNPVSLINMLKLMDKQLKPGGLDFAKTHPSPKTRIAYVEDILNSQKQPTFSQKQEKRFQAAMKNV